MRYFLIDNLKNLFYTEHYSQLVHLIRTNTCLRDLFAAAETELKKIRVSELRVSEIKKYKEPEILVFLNQNYFEVTLQLSSDLSETSALTPSKVDEPRKLMFFSFKDAQLHLLHKFLAQYDKITASPQAQQEEGESMIWFPLLLPNPSPKGLGLGEHLAKLKAVTEGLNAGTEPDEDSRPRPPGEGKGKEYFAKEMSYVGDFRGGKRHGTGYFVVGSQGMCYVESINGQVSGI